VLADALEQVAMDAQTIVDTVSSLDETTATSIITAILQSRPELAPPVVTFAVPDLTYPPSKSLNERRSKGVVKSFNAEKGFGFVECEELNAVFGSDVFVHAKQINEFTPGTTVSFAVVLNKDNRPQAYDIQHDPPKGMGKGGCNPGSGGGTEYFKGCNPGKGAGGPGPSGGGGDPNHGWGGEDSPGFNASAMLAMMSSVWGGKIGGGKGKDDGGKGKGCGGTQYAKGFGGKDGPYGKSGPLVVRDDQILGKFMGSIKSFNPKSGYGFIECPDLKAQGHQKDVFLNHQQLGEFEVGASIQFTAFLNNKGCPQAKDLEDPWGAPKDSSGGAAGGDGW